MKSILDPEFKYTPSFLTDIRATFRRVREEQKQAQQQQPGQARHKITVLVPSKSKGSG